MTGKWRDSWSVFCAKEQKEPQGADCSTFSRKDAETQKIRLTISTTRRLDRFRIIYFTTSAFPLQCLSLNHFCIPCLVSGMGRDRVEQRREMIRPMTRCFCPFGHRGKWSSDRPFGSSAPKIPYGGFSPVRLQAGCQQRLRPSRG